GRRDALHETVDGVPMAAKFIGGADLAHMERFGTKPETFAQISVKARRHAQHNPNAAFRDLVTVEEVMASPQIYGPLTRLQCCPPTSGAAAVVLVSAEAAARKGIDAKVRIAGQALTSDTPATWSGDMRHVVGYGV